VERRHLEKNQMSDFTPEAAKAALDRLNESWSEFRRNNDATLKSINSRVDRLDASIDRRSLMGGGVALPALRVCRRCPMPSASS
jgi:hypothetical protein